MKWFSLYSPVLAMVLFAGCGGPRVNEKSQAESVQPIVVTDSNFNEVVLKSDKPVLVDFWATWCGPCKEIAPAVEEIANDYKGRALVAKLDIDVASETAARYQVSSIPTLIVFHNGEEVSRVVGVVDKSELTSKLNAVVR